MKISFNAIIFLTICLLVTVNIAIFVKGIELGKDINYYEKELKNLQQQNIELEQKVYKLESHDLSASYAAELDYGKYNEPIYFQLPAYAFKN